MLKYELTPHHAGVILWGDYHALERLHKLIHHVANDGPFINDEGEFILDLAYDVRKAFQGNRRLDYVTYPNEDQTRVYGVEILWPGLLVRVGVLRHAMGFMPTSGIDQSVMFELEYIVHAAVRDVMPKMADDVIREVARIGSLSSTHLGNVLPSRALYFIKLPARQRKKMLPELMKTFDPLYGILPFRLSIPLNAFTEDEEEPDFEW